MRTLIFSWELDNDLYNSNQTMEQLLDGKQAEWKIWTAGDARRKATKAEHGDRFLFYKKISELSHPDLLKMSTS